MINVKRIARVLTCEYGYDKDEAMEIAEDMRESLEEAMQENNYSEVEEIFLENGIDLDYVVECVL